MSDRLTTDAAVTARHIRALAARGGPRRTDPELLHDFVAKGDEGAFAALVARHGDLVLGVCRRALRSREDAEDAFQATFLVLALRAASVRRRESLASWLHGVAYRTAQNARRAAARRRRHEGDVMSRLQPDPAADASWREVQAVLDEEVARLAEPIRAPFVHCF